MESPTDIDLLRALRARLQSDDCSVPNEDLRALMKTCVDLINKRDASPPSDTGQLPSDTVPTLPALAAVQLNVGLMSLPLELRQEIYEYVLTAMKGAGEKIRPGKIYIGPSHKVLRSGLGDGIEMNSWAAQPPLTRVSREIRAESLPIYYGKNWFTTYVFSNAFLCGLTESTESSSEEAKYTESGNADLIYDVSVLQRWLRAIGPVCAAHIRHFRVLYTVVPVASETFTREILPPGIEMPKARILEQLYIDKDDQADSGEWVEEGIARTKVAKGLAFFGRLLF